MHLRHKVSAEIRQIDGKGRDLIRHSPNSFQVAGKFVFAENWSFFPIKNEFVVGKLWRKMMKLISVLAVDVIKVESIRNRVRFVLVMRT